MKTILLVCTGNTCRSSMAEGILKNLCRSVNDLKIISAGISAVNGSSAASKSIEVMKEKEICLLNHTATVLTEKMVLASDLILTMTLAHKHAVISMMPAAKVKTYTLKEYTRKSIANGDDSCLDCCETKLPQIAKQEPPLIAKNDILDPFGQSIDIYRKTANEIEECLKILCEELGSV
ncbi:MAG: protein tyrosine phosphatase [Alkaliphilus sp.]|nr:low molecular weight protein arginine phosphatase [bacterium AH-315-L21]MBN4062594.1 low molecular weight protein arginine phosphatase [Alkaliphilus sp. AH-315-G20]PHS35410.1 MAG: protein tyrosine phosphatase [Alkaliphilus sp.]